MLDILTAPVFDIEVEVAVVLLGMRLEMLLVMLSSLSSFVRQNNSSILMSSIATTGPCLVDAVPDSIQ